MPPFYRAPANLNPPCRPICLRRPSTSTADGWPRSGRSTAGGRSPCGLASAPPPPPTCASRSGAAAAVWRGASTSAPSARPGLSRCAGTAACAAAARRARGITACWPAVAAAGCGSSGRSRSDGSLPRARAALVPRRRSATSAHPVRAAGATRASTSTPAAARRWPPRARDGSGRTPLRPGPLRQLRDRAQRERAARLLVLAPAHARPGAARWTGCAPVSGWARWAPPATPAASAATSTSSCAEGGGPFDPLPRLKGLASSCR